MDEIQREIIKNITERTYNFAGTSLMFTSHGFTKSIICNKVVYYHTKTPLFDKKGINYEIKLRIMKEVVVDPKISRFKKCLYCQGKKCQTRLTCCGKPCHYMCAANHNFACGCSQKQGTEKLIHLSDSNTTDDDDTNCIVCMEECKTVTECGHRICRGCVDTLHQMHQNKTSCPMCRKNLVTPKESEFITEEFTMLSKNPNLTFEYSGQGVDIKVRVELIH